MSARTLVVLCAALLLSAGSGDAGADITLDAARSLGERVMGFAFGDTTPDVRHVADFDLADFKVTAPDGAACRVRVDLTNGRLESYMVEALGPSGGDQVSGAEAHDVAQAEARRLLGEDADHLAWQQVHSPYAGNFRFRGTAPMLGDPPRVGLSPVVTVDVLAAGGRVASYHQLLPTDRSPIGCRVSAEEATRVAAETLPRAGQKVIEEPVLHQWRGKLWWHVFIEAPVPKGDPLEHLGRVQWEFRIDAVTGEVIEKATQKGGSGPESARRPGRGTRSWASVAGGGSVLVVAGMLGYVGVRWRKSRLARLRG